MAEAPDRTLIGDMAWQKALAREAVIRPIAFQKNLTAPERFAACRELGLKPTRFYQLLAQFRRKPVTSSLLDETPGPEKGRRLLSSEQEDAVTCAIQETYCRGERPTITAVHDHVWVICRIRHGIERLVCFSTAAQVWGRQKSSENFCAITSPLSIVERM